MNKNNSQQQATKDDNELEIRVNDSDEEWISWNDDDDEPQEKV